MTESTRLRRPSASPISRATISRSGVVRYDLAFGAASGEIIRILPPRRSDGAVAVSTTLFIGGQAQPSRHHIFPNRRLAYNFIEEFVL